ncbi:GDP-mannose mannosyl hydrolase [Sodalis ligni]|uniref:Colanic acid biosynthesis protein WcaH n=1 Tax=Sodalis ligni TaxID=2697027 RepID=A0A4R1NSA4_9GAMM|nr:GDP-mannose mannosyl hydrolase [Sodalis ligni]TCL07340.1 colanic acid biosynthesis protein WcaH [Sodalis ligni]
MFLRDSVFKKIIKYTPLISIDLIIKNEKDAVLLGQRKNRPAQGFWFVPGGRITKNESLEEAFNRLTYEEINVRKNLEDASFLGIYEHFYEDNFFNKKFSTHYIVLAYFLQIDIMNLNLKKVQHHSFVWKQEEELLNDEKVHKNTKAYFMKN